MPVKVQDCFTWERTFTEQDVRLFSQLSGDQGTHHIETDAAGRLMVHGLLTATIPTKIGGDLNFIAREMTYEFLRPVFTGDAIRCDVVVTNVESSEGRTNVALTATCRNQHGKEVLIGRCRGVILD